MAEVRRLKSFPRHQLLSRPAVVGLARELDLLEHLGDPTAESNPSDPTPRFFWDLAWSCGLLMGVEFDQLSEEIAVLVDQAEIDHALRHLGAPVRAIERGLEPLVGSWALWHRRADVEVCVADALTERDARCRLDEHVAGGESGWWVASLGDPAAGPFAVGA